MTIFLSIVILILLAYVVYKEAFEKKPNANTLDFLVKKIESTNFHIITVDNHLVDLKKDLTSRMLTVHDAIEKQDIAILGQNKAVSDLVTAYNFNTANIKARLEKVEKAITNKSFDGIIETDFTPILNELVKLQKTIEAVEDAPIYVEK